MTQAGPLVEPQRVNDAGARRTVQGMGRPRRRWNRKTAYVVMMGTCLTLFVLAWGVVRFVSVPVAVAMSVVAALIPPAAVIVANYGALEGTELPDFNQHEEVHRHDAARPDER